MSKRKLFSGSPGKINDGTSAFMSPSGLVRTFPNKATSHFMNVVSGGMITYDAYQSLSPKLKSQFVNLTKSALSNFNNNNKNKTKNKMNGRNNNRPSTRFKQDNGSAEAGTFYLSKAVNPVPVSLNSGIKPNTYVSDYMDAIENHCSPLHISSGIIKIPTTSTLDLYQYFNRVITFDIQSKAQANVGFNLDITNNFSASQILTAINALIYALQVYFYYASVITYHDNPANKNMGMIAIRNAFTVDNFNDLALLGRRLADTPCPPNLFNFIKYMSGNYLTGPNPMSPMIKIIPGQCTYNGLISVSDLSTALSNLTNDTTNEVFSLLRRAVPQWVPGTLSDVSSAPVYDENFKTIFANIPFRVEDAVTGTSMGFPYITDGSDVQYNSYSNNLDGAAFAMCGYYATNDDDTTGLIYPFNSNGSTYRSSRRSYYEVGGIKQFYPAEEYVYITLSRPETYKAAGNGTSEVLEPLHLPGASKCLGVNVNSITETTYKVLDWLMSLDTIRNDSIKKQVLNT